MKLRVIKLRLGTAILRILDWLLSRMEPSRCRYPGCDDKPVEGSYHCFKHGAGL